MLYLAALAVAARVRTTHDQSPEPGTTRVVLAK
jgi:hypothetical protein